MAKFPHRSTDEKIEFYTSLGFSFMILIVIIFAIQFSIEEPANTRRLDKKPVLWGFIASIVFHTIVGVFLILWYFSREKNQFGDPKVILTLGWLLILFSSTAVLPLIRITAPEILVL